MTERGTHTYSEIMSQPQVWTQTLEAFERKAPALDALRDLPLTQALFIGCGSTHYLSMTGAALYQTLTNSSGVTQPSSAPVLFPDLVFVSPFETLLVAVSRSGTTTETVAAVKAFRERTAGKGRVVVITCDEDTPLGQTADLCLAASAAQEQSVAQTRSFSSMLVLAQAMAAHLAGKQTDVLGALPAALERLFADHHNLARTLGEDTGIERFFFLGSGLLHGIACEAMLKMKEMSLSYSEAFHMLEFRHGPMSMVDEKTLIVGLVSAPAYKQELSVLRQMQGYGARILAIAEEAPAGDFDGWADMVALRSGLPEWARPALYLPLLQLLGYYRAMSRGQNPDRPAKLDAVVSLDADTLE